MGTVNMKIRKGLTLLELKKIVSTNAWSNDNLCTDKELAKMEETHFINYAKHYSADITLLQCLDYLYFLVEVEYQDMDDTICYINIKMPRLYCIL